MVQIGMEEWRGNKFRTWRYMWLYDLIMLEMVISEQERRRMSQLTLDLKVLNLKETAMFALLETLLYLTNS